MGDLGANKPELRGREHANVAKALKWARRGLAIAIATEYSFIYRPGGAPGGTVYTTWPTLMAAVGAVDGPKLIAIDGSLAGPSGPLTTAGAWNLNNVTWTTYNGAGALLDFLGFVDGSTIVADAMAIVGGAQLYSLNTVSAVWTMPAAPPNGTALLVVDGINSAVFGDFNGIGAHPLLAVTAGTPVLQLARQCSFGDGTHPAITISLGATADFSLYAGKGAIGPMILPNALAGAGTALVVRDSSATVGAPQAVGTLTQDLADLAPGVSYTPGVPGNWVAPPPTTVQQALDRIAANVANAHPIP